MAATAPPTTVITGGRQVARPRSRRRLGVYLLLIPASLPILVALGYPLVRQFITSFQEYGLAQQFGQPAEWVGLANYTELLSDPYVWTVIWRSIAFCLVNAAVTMVIGIAFAVLMARVGAAARITLQVSLLLAWGTPVLASMTVWQWLFDSQYGVINYVLSHTLGLEQMAGHSWIIEPLSFYFVATVIVVWGSVPFVAFSVYAGLLQVPNETMEAAQLDGASARQRFWNITMPMVRPVLSIVLLLQVIWDFKVFTQIYVMTNGGGVAGRNLVLNVYAYQQAFAASEYGLGAAIGVVMTVLLLVITLFYLRALRRSGEVL